ncbi:hypothetical protein GNF98_21795, partial [Clostridium perfringens]
MFGNKIRVQALAAKHIVKGTTKTTFSPNAKVTRAEFAALLVRTLDLTPADREYSQMWSALPGMLMKSQQLSKQKLLE